FGVNVNEPSLAMVIEPPCVVANGPGETVSAVPKSFANSVVLEDTNGLDGAAAAATSCVLPTVVYESGLPIGEIVSVYDCCPMQPFASVALAMSVNTPVCVGVPLSVAVLLPLSTNVRPAGRAVPAFVHTTG